MDRVQQIAYRRISATAICLHLLEQYHRGLERLHSIPAISFKRIAKMRAAARNGSFDLGLCAAGADLRRIATEPSDDTGLVQTAMIPSEQLDVCERSLAIEDIPAAIELR